MSYVAIKHREEYSRALGSSLDELRKMTPYQLFRCGLDTQQIAHIHRIPEFKVLKSITRARDARYGVSTGFTRAK